MKDLKIALVAFLLCSVISAHAGVVITGHFGSRGVPCFTLECPTLAVYQLSNDTASFVLTKDGQYIETLDQLGNYTFDDEASFYGDIL